MNSFDQNEFEGRFTKTTVALKYIKELELLDLEKTKYEDLEKTILNYFPIFPFISGGISPGHRLYMARVSTDNRPYQRLEEILLHRDI